MNEFLPKWLVNGLGGLLVIFVAFLIVQQVYNFNQLVNNQKPANTISVSADGKVTAVPDLATVDIGVLTQGSTATEVTTQNNQKVNQVIAYIKQQGISSQDITTSELNLSPQQSYGEMLPGGSSTPKITGYQGEQTVTVKVHGVDTDQSVLDTILDGAVNNGANEINDVNLSFNDPTALQQKAELNAIDNAKLKAQALASEAGLTLGKVVSVSETNSELPQPTPFEMNASVGAIAAQAPTVAPNVQPGSQEIDESMTVTYEVN
jgi:uncharacterized protein